MASQTGACPEICAGAALLADPYSYRDFADKMKQVLLSDERLREEMKSKSLQRAKFFDYARSAKIVIEKIGYIISDSK